MHDASAAVGLNLYYLSKCIKTSAEQAPQCKNVEFVL